MAERGVDHLHEVDNIEHRQPCSGLDIGAIRRHIGAFEDDGPDFRALGAQDSRYPNMLPPCSLDVERKLIPKQHAGEFFFRLQAGHG